MDLNRNKKNNIELLLDFSEDAELVKKKQYRTKCQELFENSINFLSKMSKALKVSYNTEMACIDQKGYFQKAQLKLQNRSGIAITDLNRSILKVLCTCLHYYKNAIQEEDADFKYLYKTWRNLCVSILIFVSSPILLESSAFRKIVSLWISDLLKVFGEADGERKRDPKYLPIFNLIMKILVALAHNDLFFEHIVREIMKKLNFLLSFYKVHSNFGPCVRQNHTPTLYLLLIMKHAISDAMTREYYLSNEEVVKYREELETLSKCLTDGKCCSALNDSVNNILRFL